MFTLNKVNVVEMISVVVRLNDIKNPKIKKLGCFHILKAGTRAGQIKQNIADRFDRFCTRNGP